MATTTNNRLCWVDLTNIVGSGSPYQQVLFQESNKVTVRIPYSTKYGTGTFANFLKFTITLKKEGK